jgi:integrase
LDGKNALWRIPSVRMKGDRDRKAEIGGDHLVPLAWQSVEVFRALHPLTGTGPLVFPSVRHAHRPMSENAIGYMLIAQGIMGAMSHMAGVPHSRRS